MSEPTYLYDTVDTAERMGLPTESVFAAMSFAAFPSSSWRDVERIEMGNGTALEVKLDLLPGEGRVLVSIIGHGAYVFERDGSLLHWSYVHEKFSCMHQRWGQHRNEFVCDSVALTCLLGIALQRPVGIDGACDCPRHGGG